MDRIKLHVPESFRFSVVLPVRITDLNYGNHLANTAVLEFIHEARMQFLSSMGYGELDFEGTALIMADSAIQYKKQAFFKDQLKVEVEPAFPNRAGFNLYYRMTNQSDELVALAKTGMVCFDYKQRKTTSLPEKAKQKLFGDSEA